MDASTPAGSTLDVTGDGAADGEPAAAVRVGAAAAGDEAEAKWLGSRLQPPAAPHRHDQGRDHDNLARFLDTAPTVVIVAPSDCTVSTLS